MRDPQSQPFKSKRHRLLWATVAALLTWAALFALNGPYDLSGAVGAILALIGWSLFYGVIELIWNWAHKSKQ
jgi:hypothetical protein